MPQIRVVFLWHMHQPFYKDLVTGEYRLPWVRMHALKDYYGMVRLLEEFPDSQQTFNLVPSLIAQIQDYSAGTARDPFLDLIAKPSADLTLEERHLALKYLFQANPERMIRRYPRYAELYEHAQQGSSVDVPEKRLKNQDFTDLQVLSQLAWFDEFFLEEPAVRELIQKGSGYTYDDQQQIVALERELIARVIPEYKRMSEKGSIEISVSPFYHPILPLLCDTNVGRESCPGIPLPHRFQHPEDAREQLRRGIELHEQVFGTRPRGTWPSEGSVSEEVLGIAAELGLKWIATDEGVLGRTSETFFDRDSRGKLKAGSADGLYKVYRYEHRTTAINLLFRDHSLSDLIGFVYSGMDPKDAANHFVGAIRDSAQSVIESGSDATVPVILDGENAWEHYPQSGREFLRRLYDAIPAAGMEMVTVSEAIESESEPRILHSLVPGSWINANFNVWIGAPEDNVSWNYLKAARDFYSENSAEADDAQKKLAFDELLIAEGSDWNWWYGPEHHSANDAEFDELYRKHLSNVYRVLGAAPPDYLAHSIIQTERRPSHWVPQTSYIHPVLDGDTLRYFDWLGAAMISADSRDSAMHGREMLLGALYAGIDEENFYCRVDLKKSDESLDLIINLESAENEGPPSRKVKIEATIERGALVSICRAGENGGSNGRADSEVLEARLGKIFALRIPLLELEAAPSSTLRVRASAWRNGLPLDALPPDGWIELEVTAEENLQQIF